MEQLQETSIDLLESQPLSVGYLEDMQALWEKEYGLNPTIPSSRRLTPAHALVQLAGNYDLSVETALDLGCGNGRNAFYLAAMGISVTAIDISQIALDILETEQKRSGASGTIRLENRDIRDGLPLATSSVDLVLDSYCLCHFVDKNELKDAMAEVYRVLKPGGRLVKIHLDDNDAYYLDRLKKRTSYGYISYDPSNGLSKMHMSLDSYLHQVCGGFDFIKSESVKFTDNVRGAYYERSIFVCVTQKPST